MPRTFMEGAMRGYGFMDDIVSRRQNREDRLKQQQFRNRMTRRADSRAQERLETEKQQASQQQAAQALEGLLMAEDPDPQLIQHFEQQLGNSPFWYLLPENRRAIQTLEGVAQNPRKINTPEGLEAFNTVYGPQLNKNLGGQGQQGGKIKGKRAAAIVPGRKPGTFAVDLAVDFEHDDGRAGSYPAPATVGRGTEPDAQVLEVDAEKAAESLAGKSAVSEILNTPGVRDKLMQWYVALGGDPDVFREEEGDANWRSAGGGMLFNAKTGETRQIEGYPREEGGGDAPYRVSGDVVYNQQTGEYERIPANDQEKEPQAPWRVSGGVIYNQQTGETQKLPDNATGSDAPADQKLAEWLLNNGVAKTPTEAWNKVRQARFSPQKFVADHVAETMQAQRDAYIEPGHPEYRTPREVATEAQEILRSTQVDSGADGGGQGGGNGDDPLGIRY